MLDEAARWDDLVIGLRPMSYGEKGVLARCLVSVGPMTTAKASSEGWRLRLRPNKHTSWPTIKARSTATLGTSNSYVASTLKMFQVVHIPRFLYIRK
jgi:hypothetical protein